MKSSTSGRLAGTRTHPWNLDAGPPIRGRHYPSDDAMFDTWFRSDEACARYLAVVRWRHGLVCPRCGSERFTSNGTAQAPRWWCADCRRVTTVTSQTLLDHHRLPLSTVLLACWWWAQEHEGFSARSLAGWLGVHEASAWNLAGTIRRAAGRMQPPLRGQVELDDRLLPMIEPMGRRSLRFQRVRIIIAAQRVGASRIGAIRVSRLSSLSPVGVSRFVRRNIAPGSVVVTDSSRTMAAALVTLPYTHRPEGLGLGDDERVSPVARCATVEDRFVHWLSTVHGGAVEHQHLHAYIDDFVFRFNRRHMRDRGRIWFELVEGLLNQRIDRRA